MDYADKVLEKLNSHDLDENLWGATFAGGAGGKADQVVGALIALLQRDESKRLGEEGDIKYELCIGRAAVWLARLIAGSHPIQRVEYVATRAILANLVLRNSFQIAAHAREGLDLLEKKSD